LRSQLAESWTIVLRNQFHDVLPGTSIGPVYDDARAEYARAQSIVEAVAKSADAALPRAPGRERRRILCAPRVEGDSFAFDNGVVRARVLHTGAIVDLHAAEGRNVVAQANLLALYDDRPAKWEAWNIDAGYRRSHVPVQPQEPAVVEDGLEIPFRIGGSAATMRVTLERDEPFLRVDVAVNWVERRKLLRIESWLAVETDRATFGAPHGVVHRSGRRETPAERARYEVPGQRYALACDEAGAGVAIFALDTYGWSARTLRDGGIAVGHSLLRSTSWPDPEADRGEHRLSWAFAPVAKAPIGAIEGAWEQFAGEPRVRLFSSDDESARIVACKVAEDGDGVIVRLRECDGASRTAKIRCGARMREVVEVDGLERSLDRTVPIEGESFAAILAASGLRSYRVRF
jgi:alpha-mannosidase